MEIVTRPQPREEPVVPGKRIAGVVLAAGRSTRMGGAEQAACANPRQAVGAHRASKRHWRRAQSRSSSSPGISMSRLKRRSPASTCNSCTIPILREGLGTSLRAGVAAVPAEADGVVVCLGDMPQVTAALIDRLIAAYDSEKGALVVAPTRNGQRGNPVLWARRFFPDLMAITGDVGARHVLANYGEAVVEVPVAESGAFVDVDTPEALNAAKAEMERA